MEAFSNPVLQVDLQYYQAIIQVSAILIGFEAVLITFYLDKIHSFRRDYVQQSHELFRPINQLSSPAVWRHDGRNEEEKWRRNNLYELGQFFTKELKNILNNERQKMLEYTNKVEAIIISFSAFTMILYGFTLIFALMMLAFPNQLQYFSFKMFSFTAASVTIAVYYTITDWRKKQELLQALTDQLEDMYQRYTDWNLENLKMILGRANNTDSDKTE